MLKVHDKINRKQGKDNSNWGKTFCNMTQMRSYISTTEIASKCRHANTVKSMGERLKKKKNAWYRNKNTMCWGGKILPQSIVLIPLAHL